MPLTLARKMGIHDAIQNCAVEFRRRCPRQWAALEETDDATVRFCSTCARSVHYCEDEEKAIKHARAGDCIAMKVQDGNGLPVVYFGEPEDPEPVPTEEQKSAQKRLHYERERQSALQNVKYTDEECPVCGFAQPHWHKECRVCALK